MKKRILALICAAVMTIGMSMTVCAAGSPNAGAAATEELVKAEDNTTGQVITTNTITYFAETTTIEGVAGATLKEVPVDTAKVMITQAKTIAGKDTFIASVVDLSVPAGTGKATFTLGCPNVWKGQNVTILHQKSDGSFENIKPDKVEDNKVTFTMTSYSPIAIVINTAATAPKTGDIFAVVAAMAAISGLGAAACGKKAKKN
ncbi:MAG: hypothetical protein ACI4HQ_11305 [Acetatifactor sp.]